MRADLCTRDELLTGLQREASIIGMYKCSNKVIQAVAAWCCLLLLDVGGFKSQGGQEGRQNQTVVILIRILYAGVPSLTLLASAIPLCLYTLTRTVHASMLLDLRSRVDNG